jgi:alcohol dehydrogenase, propanol-preferring
MVLARPRQPRVACELPTPAPGPGQIRIDVEACGVCRTDLHIVDGELTEPKLPLVPGHQIAGVVGALGAASPRRAWPTPATCSRCRPGYSALEAAPLLCAALIGYRALRLAGPGPRLGLYGFGAAGRWRWPRSRPAASSCAPGST